MKISIQENEAWQRFDRFLRKYFKKNSEIKLWDIYLWIRKWSIKLNWKKAPEDKRLELDDEITIELQDTEKNPLISTMTKSEKKKEIDISEIKKYILFEDQNWIFWDKPPGLVIHPWNKHTDDLTLNEYLEIYVENTMKELNSTTFKPAFCFRLDKDTSGIIIAAKNYDALKYLNELIRLRKTDKTYLAIVKWIAPKSKMIEASLFRGFNKKFWKAQTVIDEFEGQEAKTWIKLIKTKKDKFLGDISLVEAKIYTWRMHQIRAHLSHIGYPIIWDLMYGDPALNRLATKNYKITRQLLHSWKYWFNDKFKKQNIEIQSKIPQDFKLFDLI